MIEIFGKPNCPQCDKAKTICDLRGLQYEYKIVDVDFTKEELFEQFPTARTFPQIRVNGTAVGGCDDFEKYLEDTNSGSTEGQL